MTSSADWDPKIYATYLENLDEFHDPVCGTTTLIPPSRLLGSIVIALLNILTCMGSINTKQLKKLTNVPQ
jgi:hypothetical protein